MTPASLKRNYIEELKGCGNEIYKKNHYWEWVDMNNLENDTNIPTLSSILHLPIDYIIKNGGAWVIDYTKPENYNTLTQIETKSLDKQIDKMIEQKYEFIKYNGITNKKLKEMTQDHTVNIFDNAVIVIDEAHNFISRIVNKIEKEPLKERGKEHSGNEPKVYKDRFLNLYEMLLTAKNARVVLLSGTPVINYPNEVAILFNILHGYTKVWNFPIDISKSSKVVDTNIRSILNQDKYINYLEFERNKSISITRIPYGFENVYDMEYKGMSLQKTDTESFLSDDEFKTYIIDKLNKNKIIINQSKITTKLLKHLPDTSDEFINRFVNVEQKTLKNAGMLQRRILGLSSHFRSAQEGLLPKYDKNTDYIVEQIPMSDLQYKLYIPIRNEEREQERNTRGRKRPKKEANNEMWKEPSSTYRIFSRLYCNYVIPEEPGRPFPKTSAKKTDEEANIIAVNNLDKDAIEISGNILKDGDIDGDEVLNSVGDKTYANRIVEVLKFIKDNGDEYLSEEGLKIHSPKFLAILKNIKNPDNEGLHLLYSQFRTLEGIELFKLVLEKNGYAQFKIKKRENGSWKLDIKKSDMNKPKFALYTGTESAEEKEAIRNIYNGQWNKSDSITAELKKISKNNNMGEIIKLLIITASGSEGINLRNTRFVHLMEPYWHPVRFEQVIGRARRICSHASLPEELQTVKVFVYLITFTNKQIELMDYDKSKNKYSINSDTYHKTIDDKGENIPLTSDEFLFEISNIKERLNTTILNTIKETSIDCSIYAQRVTKDGTIEHQQCISFGSPKPDTYAYEPSYLKDSDLETKHNLNKQVKELNGQELFIDDKMYILSMNDETHGDIYDTESYYRAARIHNIEPLKIGTLTINATTGDITPYFFK